MKSRGVLSRTELDARTSSFPHPIESILSCYVSEYVAPQLKTLHPQNPPNRETQTPQYKSKSNHPLNLNLYSEIPKIPSFSIWWLFGDVSQKSHVFSQKSHVFSQKSQVFTLAFWRCSIFNGICYSTTTVETATFPRRYRLYLNIYNRFYSTRYNSDIHLSEKLKMVSRNPNQTTISI